MERPSRGYTLMEHAKLVAARGTCARLQVGALVHREGRILVTGYNGAPAGLPHCVHGTCICRQQKDQRTVGLIDSSHTQQCRSHDFAACKAQHAERNCIDWAARHGIRLEGAELVSTDTPCYQCAGSIINAGILSVVSLRAYRLSEGVEMLRAAGVSCSLYEEVIA